MSNWNSPVWADYDRWNQAIADVVFPVLDEIRPVYLDLEDDLVEALGERLHVPVADVVDKLCSVVAATLDRDRTAAAVFDRHYRRVATWSRRREETPPMLGVLATFSLAAEQMSAGDGMSSSNYFGRLAKVLSWQPGDPNLEVAYRSVVERFWEELNRWLVHVGGERGTPTAYALAHRYVGLSVSQALVRGRDRQRLWDFFHIFGFAPGSEVAPADLIPLLDSWISQANSPVSASLQRLWSNGQARGRIAEAAAVTLAAWDGRLRSGEAAQNRSRASVALTLELTAFPRRRFGLSALLTVPEADDARGIEVKSSDEPVVLDFVPHTPGVLRLAPGHMLDAEDVLSGVLELRDPVSGLSAIHRPRRVLIFRENELTRQWVEFGQVMLGDDVRLVVQDALRERVEAVLGAIARPGWSVADGYPDAPAGWTTYIGVEVLAHPGPLISADKLDDLAGLVPLTTTTLKIAGGFALPGSVRGKWHRDAPPEIRAVSDGGDGFTVRLLRTSTTEGATEEVLGAWGDEGAGALVHSLQGLGLGDGDYRVELVRTGETTPATSTTFYLRSGESPDVRQWHLAESISYGEGIGALGVSNESDATVQGFLAYGDPVRGPLLSADVPMLPTWTADESRRRPATVRPTVAKTDIDSCISTGRHREWIDTVEVDRRGYPLIPWTYGRCKSCGLERRYPTKLRRDGSHRVQASRPASATVPVDVKSLEPVKAPDSVAERWTVAFDALMHLGGGSWSSFEKVALQVEPSAIFVDTFARTLEVEGHISVERDSATLQAIAWEISPTSLLRTADGYRLVGYWPADFVQKVAGELDVAIADGDGHSRPYLVAGALNSAQLATLEAHDIEIANEGWEAMAALLPRLSDLLAALPKNSASLVGTATRFDVDSASWVECGGFESPGAYRVRQFATIDFVRTDEDVAAGTITRCSVQLAKHIAAYQEGALLMAHDPATLELRVPLGADLPAIYGRAAVAASGRSPYSDRRTGALIYAHVPVELAQHLAALLTN